MTPGSTTMTDTPATVRGVAVSTRDVHLSFGSNQVLRGVDLDVPAATTACVIGPSGSGKSTLLRVVNRLLEPERGDVLLDGRSVLRDNPDEPAPAGGHGLPALQPLPAQDRPGQRHSGTDQAQGALEGRGGRAGTAPPRAGRPRPQGRRAPRQPLRGSAAAGGHRPGPRHGARGHALRRGDLGPRP